MTPAHELARAAATLRDLAGKATPGPWRAVCDGYGDTSGGTSEDERRDLLWLRSGPTNAGDIVSTYGMWTERSEADLLYLQALDPLVGAALADWLDAEAGAMVEFAEAWPHWSGEAQPGSRWHAALAVARAVNGEVTPVTAPEPGTTGADVREALDAHWWSATDDETCSCGWVAPMWAEACTGSDDEAEHAAIEVAHAAFLDHQADAVLAALPAPAAQADPVARMDEWFSMSHSEQRAWAAGYEKGQRDERGVAAARTGDTGREALVHDGHAYAPGIDEEQPEWADPRWCNTCGEQVKVPLARAAAVPDTPDAEVVAPTTGCRCPGHRMPGVSHVVACCDQPHVPDTPDDTEDGEGR